MIEKIDTIPSGTDIQNKVLRLKVVLSSRVAGDRNEIGRIQLKGIDKGTDQQIMQMSQMTVRNQNRDLIVQNGTRNPLMHRMNEFKLDGGTGAFYVTLPAGFTYRTVAFWAYPFETGANFFSNGTQIIGMTVSANRWTITNTGFDTIYTSNSSGLTSRALAIPTLFVATKATNLAGTQLFFGSTASTGSPTGLSKLTINHVMAFPNAFSAGDADALYKVFYNQRKATATDTMNTSMSDSIVPTSQTWTITASA